MIIALATTLRIPYYSAWGRLKITSQFNWLVIFRRPHATSKYYKACKLCQLHATQWLTVHETCLIMHRNIWKRANWLVVMVCQRDEDRGKRLIMTQLTIFLCWSMRLRAFQSTPALAQGPREGGSGRRTVSHFVVKSRRPKREIAHCTYRDMRMRSRWAHDRLNGPGAGRCSNVSSGSSLAGSMFWCASGGPYRLNTAWNKIFTAWDGAFVGAGLVRIDHTQRSHKK